MRTTIDIDDDLLVAVKEVARREGRSAGSVLSELARRALQTRVEAPVEDDLGFATIGKRPDVVVSPALIELLLEETAE